MVVNPLRPIAVQTIKNYRRYVSRNPPRYDSGQLIEGDELQMMLDAVRSYKPPKRPIASKLTRIIADRTRATDERTSASYDPLISCSRRCRLTGENQLKKLVDLVADLTIN